MPTKNSPIGVFDSGVGGITVVSALRQLLPFEDIIYLGDTARMPYGEKSAEEIREYVAQDIEFLEAKGVKLIICACNTASAVGLTDQSSNLPIVSMLNDNLTSSLVDHHAKRVLVLATSATVNSHAYRNLLSKLTPHIEVTEIAGRLLAPLVEEGLANTPIAKETIEHYLEPVKDENFDAVILGCTHYPLLAKHFKQLFPDALLLDSASFAAQETQEILSTLDLLSDNKTTGTLDCYVTDQPSRFDAVSALFFETTRLQHSHCDAKLVHLD